MSAPTPGPWKHDGAIVRSGDSVICEVSDPRRGIVVRHARISRGSRDFDEAMANARLIAAAPELYGVAREAENLITGLGHNGGAAHGICGPCDTLTALREAIARAEGREP